MSCDIIKSAKKLSWLCTFVYFSSYLTRINYAAVMVEMIAREGFTKSGASSALTGLFFTYGVGQIISGYLGDKIKPDFLIFSGLAVSSAMNLLIPFCPGTSFMTVVWCINGLAQAFMWPPLVKIMSSLLNESEYKSAVVRVSWGSSFSTIFVYLTAPLYITIGNWKLVFFMSALFAIIMALVWMLSYHKLEKKLVMREDTNIDYTQKDQKKLAIPRSIYKILAFIILAVAFQGLLRDGITSWTPSYISEVFDMENTISIFTSILLPIFSIFSFQIVFLLNRRIMENELLCATVSFAVGMFSLLLLWLTGSSFMILSVFSLALAVGSMHGVNLMLICVVPAYFNRLGKTSLVSGVLNSCVYLGSTVSTYGIALLAETFGWNLTVLVWCAIALAGTLFCAVCIAGWQKFKLMYNE